MLNVMIIRAPAVVPLYNLCNGPRSFVLNAFVDACAITVERYLFEEVARKTEGTEQKNASFSGLVPIVDINLRTR